MAEAQYNIFCFIKNGTIDDCAHVTGLVSQSSADIEYNVSCTSEMELSNFRILNN